MDVATRRHVLRCVGVLRFFASQLTDADWLASEENKIDGHVIGARPSSPIRLLSSINPPAARYHGELWAATASMSDSQLLAELQRALLCARSAVKLDGEGAAAQAAAQYSRVAALLRFATHSARGLPGDVNEMAQQLVAQYAGRAKLLRRHSQSEAVGEGEGGVEAAAAARAACVASVQAMSQNLRRMTVALRLGGELTPGLHVPAAAWSQSGARIVAFDTKRRCFAAIAAEVSVVTQVARRAGGVAPLKYLRALLSSLSNLHAELHTHLPHLPHPASLDASRLLGSCESAAPDGAAAFRAGQGPGAGGGKHALPTRGIAGLSRAIRLRAAKTLDRIGTTVSAGVSADELRDYAEHMACALEAFDTLASVMIAANTGGAASAEHEMLWMALMAYIRDVVLEIVVRDAELLLERHLHRGHVRLALLGDE